MSSDSRHSRGLAYGVSAYAVWGLFPLYWPLLKPAGALEILAHRMVWSLVFLAFVDAARRNWSDIRKVLVTPRTRNLLAFAAVLISVNWGLYIWAVNSDHVIDASLGYFINPLINIALGVIIFRERLRRLQWVAVGVAALGVSWLTWDAGSLPWIGLALGLSFGSYGMVKKVANVDAVESLTAETLLLLPLSVGYLVWAEVNGTAAFAHAGFWQALWSVMAGVVTAIPLLAFGAAAIRIPYSTMGIMQYMTPTMQFLIGLFVFKEDMSPGRWLGFGVIWVALGIFSFDALRRRG